MSEGGEKHCRIIGQDAVLKIFGHQEGATYNYNHVCKWNLGSQHLEASVLTTTPQSPQPLLLTGLNVCRINMETILITYT